MVIKLLYTPLAISAVKGILGLDDLAIEAKVAKVYVLFIGKLD